MRILEAKVMIDGRLQSSWQFESLACKATTEWTKTGMKLLYRKERKQKPRTFGRRTHGQKSPPDVWKIRVRPVGRHKHMVVYTRKEGMQIPLAPHPSRLETGEIFAMTTLVTPVTATAPPIAREASKKACPAILHALGMSTMPNAAKGTRAACIQVFCHSTEMPRIWV
jgi:hypothetical protein